MPLTYRIDSPAGLIHITSHGRVSSSEMQEVAESLLEDPEFRSGLDVLSDSRDVSVAPSTDDARVAADLIQRVRNAGLARIAIVATSAAVYGMLQMVGSIAELRGHDVKVFDSIDEALAWLKEPPAERARSKPRASGARRRPPM